ncbi:translation initiation factor EIF-2b alpha subunit, putative [Trypanosoma equiperdum]|uniref:Translation initiation factor eIF-2B alpha subunit, putative n=4 Tax=Trypanozoon TaxID=39700 RepID=Q585B9_TRYB2|nr:translation initiation factor eIF-2B alpha subunit, putative [Trypanosoma brucei brucei TREU927]AAX80383.1 translation initiation factor eIF-2B alpha subunit, putative [Trypanosoma brucei]AAZ11691.1 translation initiation factor eIF-2B alpha subunit, putative [Trypanosoma brucei brucei TREU927]RHW72145.1 translation initiation factor EIF-2b alpha subunit [Trypanosoma brucei equiperdum]SCU71783.1 translation initiation factor EIF-2b alpha subunit, putative [Trypanosoma equiperdum]
MEVPHDDYDISIMIRVVKEVQELLTSKQFSTYSELDKEITNMLKGYKSIGDGFERFRIDLTKDAANSPDLRSSLVDMNARCESRLRDFECSQKDQINDMLPFIRSTSRILVHGCGDLLALAIACAIQEREGVHFYICEGRPATAKYPQGTGEALLRKASATHEGLKLKEKLQQYCTIIPDAGVGAVMSKVDFVVTGAYCVTEHGGLVHSTGSLQIATVASAMNVPFYVLCETFKFAHIFPLSTADLRQPEGSSDVPLVEFVPPSMVTLVFSEQGIMPPSAVTYEMFRYHTALFAPGKCQ